MSCAKNVRFHGTRECAQPVVRDRSVAAAIAGVVPVPSLASTGCKGSRRPVPLGWRTVLAAGAPPRHNYQVNAEPRARGHELGCTAGPGTALRCMSLFSCVVQVICLQ